MKNMRIVYDIGNIDADLVSAAEESERRFDKKPWAKWIVGAACVGLLLAVAFLWKEGGIKAKKKTAGEIESTPSATPAGEVFWFQTVTGIMIGGYDAAYASVDPSWSGVVVENLSEKVGDPVFEPTESAEWFYVKGHKDLRYIIRHKGDEYSLWEFLFFRQPDCYPYSEVLRLIYNITSADDISEVIVRPDDLTAGTPEAMQWKEETGTYTITNRSDIAWIYSVLSDMTWSGGGSDKLMPVNVPLDSYLYIRRDVEIKTSSGWGMEISYQAFTGNFYTSLGFNQFSFLSEEAQKRLLALFKITIPDELKGVEPEYWKPEEENGM